MIKFRLDGKDTSRRLVGLGLSERNVGELKNGNPIVVHGEELGVPFDVMIFYGVTEAAMQEKLQEFIGPDTDVRDHRGRRRN